MRGAVGGDVLAREQAIQESGMSFIEIKLLNRLFNGAHGAQILASTPCVDERTREEKYKVRVEDGPLLFRRDPYRLGSFVSIPDTEHNRKFLRGVIDAKVIEITDKKIEADIRNGVPAPNSFAAPAAATTQPQTIAELTAALNKARAAEGLPPILEMGPTGAIATSGPFTTVAPPVEVAPAVPVEPSGEGEGEGVTVENTTMPVAPVTVNGAASGTKRGFPTRRTPKSGLVTITE